MTRPKITDGEWKAGNQLERTGATYIQAGNGVNIAVACAVWRSDLPEGTRGNPDDYNREEITANARFLAASKQMAEALEAEEAWRDASGEESERLRIIANEKRKQALIAAGYSFP